MAKFQSTRPRGARHVKDVGYIARGVSIHAPAGGATLFLFSLFVFFRWFQSTRPRGARPVITDKLRNTICFNPRARGGRDTLHRADALQDNVSIHAPAGGATSFFSLHFLRKIGFNPRARGGRDVNRRRGQCLS